MKGPAGVLALVLGESVVGMAAFLVLMPLWGVVRRGFFKLCALVLGLLAIGLWGSIAAARQPGSDAATLALWLSIAFVGVTFVWETLLFTRLDLVTRVVGYLLLPIGVAMLIALAAAPPIGMHEQRVLALQLFCGAALMGAVLCGLLLGHWYLTDRRLTRGPINRFAVSLIVAVIFEAAAIIVAGFGRIEGSKEFSPILTAAGLAPWVALGMIATTALIAGMIKATLRGERPTAVQAATGFFYLAVITAFAGEIAAKVRFLP